MMCPPLPKGASPCLNHKSHSQGFDKLTGGHCLWHLFSCLSSVTIRQGVTHRASHQAEPGAGACPQALCLCSSGPRKDVTVAPTHYALDLTKSFGSYNHHPLLTDMETEVRKLNAQAAE